MLNRYSQAGVYRPSSDKLVNCTAGASGLEGSRFDDGRNGHSSGPNTPAPTARRPGAVPEAFARGEVWPPEPAKQEHRKEDAEAPSGTSADNSSDTSSPDQADENPKPPFYKRPILMAILGVAVLGAIVAGTLWWLHARQYVSTDDAFVTGHVVRVAPRVAGQIQKVLVDDNQLVEAGQLLVQLDPSDYQAKVEQATADLEAAKGKLAEAESQVTTTQATVGQAKASEEAAGAEAVRAQADLQRYLSLDPRAISQQQVDTARANATTAEANRQSAKKKTSAAEAQVVYAQSQVTSAKAGIAEAEAALTQARNNLTYTRITALQAGRVTNRTAEAGAYVNVGQALLSVVPREMWVVANFKETQITHMRVGQPVTIEVDAYPSIDFTGHVESFQTGTGAAFSLLPPENATGNYVKVVQRVPVKIVFDRSPDDQYLIAPGMSVTPKVKIR